MEFADARTLLARIAIIDNRQVDAAAVILWGDVLGGFSLDECLWALREFARANSRDYLRPAHLIEIITDKRRQWAMMNPDRTGQHADGWLTFERELEQAAATTAAIRATGIRSAFEAMEAITPKELES